MATIQPIRYLHASIPTVSRSPAIYQVSYVFIYFTILYTRRRLGIVTNEMMAVPKWRFAIIGFLEAIGVATGMAAAGIPFIVMM